MTEPVYRLSLRGKVVGEYSTGELVAKLCDGTITSKGYYYWTAGMKGWAPLHELFPTIEAPLRAEKVRIARQRYADERRQKADAEAKAQADFDQQNTYRFFRADSEYAQYTLRQLKAKWPEEALPSDMCQRSGDSNWKPAWQLQNEINALASSPKPTRTPARPRVPTQARQPAARGNHPGTTANAPTDDGAYFLTGYGGTAALVISAFLPFYRIGPFGASMMSNGGTQAGFALLILAALSGYGCAQRSSACLYVSGALSTLFLIYQGFMVTSFRSSGGGEDAGHIMAAISPQPDIGFIALIVACFMLFLAGSRASR